MKVGELVLLVSKKGSYIVEVGDGKLHTKDGVIDLVELKKKNFGDHIKTHLKEKFILIKPNIKDILEKKLKRMPQIIMPKDVAMIFAYTGVAPGSLVVDAGTGSGFLSIFLANYIKPGKVVTYEKDKRFIKAAKENIKSSGLEKFIKLKHKDISKGIDERDVDLITLDMKNSEKIVKHAHNTLVCGGWLVVYSPYIEHATKVVNKIKKIGFENIKTVENIVREWQFEKYSRPKTIGLMHTGFLTFARKIE